MECQNTQLDDDGLCRQQASAGRAGRSAWHNRAFEGRIGAMPGNEEEGADQEAIGRWGMRLVLKLEVVVADILHSKGESLCAGRTCDETVEGYAC